VPGLVTQPAMIHGRLSTGNLTPTATDEVMEIFSRLKRPCEPVLTPTRNHLAKHAKLVILLVDCEIVDDAPPAEVAGRPWFTTCRRRLRGRPRRGQVDGMNTENVP